MSVQSRVVRLGAALLIGALLWPIHPAAAQSPQSPFTLHQWASSASATSQYGDPIWAAIQAAGRPDTSGCGDRDTAWASATQDGQDALTLVYDVPVIPSEVNVYQTYNPGAITGIALVLADGSGTVPVPNSADPGTTCPGVLSVPVSGVTAPVNGVIITLDQTITGDWNEIDAVELVGAAQPGDQVSMWADFATATSAYGVGGWHPLQATSAPDVLECSDHSSAWASASSEGQDVLSVFFAAPIVASHLDIHQSYGPGAIVSVDLILPDYSRLPLANSADPGTDCPGIFSLPITETSPIIGAAIHLDQTITGEWNEIDAVQVSGQLAAQDSAVSAQWASSASATSEYGTDNWSALQATGAPDSAVCSDQYTAWASATRDGQDTLTLGYDTPVIPTAVNIYQTYNPGAITGIALVLADGSGTVPVPNSADPGTTCPGVLSIVIEGITAPVNGVVVSLDQTITGDWNEIDAVQLVGSTVP